MTSNKRGNPGSSGMKEHQQCKTSGYLWGTIFPCKLFKTCEALKSWSYNSVWRNFQCVRVCACVCARVRAVHVTVLWHEEQWGGPNRGIAEVAGLLHFLWSGTTRPPSRRCTHARVLFRLLKSYENAQQTGD